MKAWICFLLFLLVTVPALAFAQNVKNPTLLTFTSIDWASVTRHELHIVRTSDNQAIQTLVDNGPYTSENISIAINVMPVAFGEYYVVARACAAECSEDSDPSNLWDRVPGKPSKPNAQ